MTEQPSIPQPVPQVRPRAASKLADLHAQYVGAKAASKAADEELKAITDAIKLELSKAAPDQTQVDLIPANGVVAPALRLNYVESWRIDSKKLKAENPETYVQYARKSGSWRLDALKPDGGED